MSPTVARGLPRPAGKDVWSLRLYIAGQTPRSLQALANLTAICDEHLASCHQIEIVDLVEHPSLARIDEIIAIPTLVRLRPLPVRKVIGDLSDTERVLGSLQLSPASTR